MIYVRQHMISLVALDLYNADAAQLLTTAGEELDYLDRDLSDLSVRGDLDHDLADLSVRGMQTCRM